MENLPNHIGIIMDGNRRWAKDKGLAPQLGHKEGAKTLENIVRYANKIGLKYITVYAFSTENWKRTKEEVGALMGLLEHYLDKFFKEADTENIKIQFLGDITVLNKSLYNRIIKVVERTKNNTGTTFNIAFNYGGRLEIVRAVKNIAKKVETGEINIEDITEQTISDNLYTAGQPDPDLIIRTSGELRLSGFLTWQSTYSEFYFPDKHWPDFKEEDLDKAIEVYQKRNRRFGGTG